VNGLREVLDDSSEDEHEAPVASKSVNALAEEQEPGFNLLLFGPQSVMTNPNITVHPPQPVIYALCDIYLKNVDAIVKVLHGPSIRKYLQEGGQYLDYQQGSAAVEALVFSIYHAAITSMSDTQCVRQLGQEKHLLLKRYRFASEVSLMKADIVNTLDITTLQALLILIVRFICCRMGSNYVIR